MRLWKEAGGRSAIAAGVALLALGCGDDSSTVNNQVAGFAITGATAGTVAGAQTAGVGAAAGTVAGAQPTSGVGGAGAAGAVAGTAAGAQVTGGMGVAGTTAGAQVTGGMAGGVAGAAAGTASGGMDGAMAGTAAGMVSAGTGAVMTGTCRPTTNVDADGPYTPTHIERAGPTGSSWVFYPEELGEDGMLHPVFNWGPGALTGPAQYVDHLNRLASHGFVVISQSSSGNGGPEVAALDWILAENEMAGSMFYQKLDPTRVGAGGHSLGALTTMAMADDPRLALYVLVCGGCMSGRGGCGAADIHAPTVILGGDSDTGTPNFEGDYDEITSPVVFVTKDGTDHIACARNNLSPWVAFMRWQFCGEEEWRPKFFDGGEYCQSPWICKSKNF